MQTYTTFAAAADRIGTTPRQVSAAATRLRIPKPFTVDDVDRMGYSIFGPHGGMPRFEQQPDGHYHVVAR